MAFVAKFRVASEPVSYSGLWVHMVGSGRGREKGRSGRDTETSSARPAQCYVKSSREQVRNCLPHRTGCCGCGCALVAVAQRARPAGVGLRRGGRSAWRLERGASRSATSRGRPWSRATPEAGAAHARVLRNGRENATGARMRPQPQAE